MWTFTVKLSNKVEASGPKQRCHMVNVNDGFQRVTGSGCCRFLLVLFVSWWMELSSRKDLPTQTSGLCVCACVYVCACACVLQEPSGLSFSSLELCPIIHQRFRGTALSMITSRWRSATSKHLRDVCWHVNATQHTWTWTEGLQAAGAGDYVPPQWMSGVMTWWSGWRWCGGVWWSGLT